MSDEFIKIDTKEIKEDISEIEKILLVCTSDADVILQASQFQKYTHKIKGLAPMMNKQDLGDAASSLDFIFKTILNLTEIDGALKILSCIIPFLRPMLIEPNYDNANIQQQILHLKKILTL